METLRTYEKLADFLDKHAWIFKFSNVKILSEVSKWPKDWSNFVMSTSVDDLKRIFKGDSHACPSFVHEFVLQRNEILAEIEQHYVNRPENVDIGFELPNQLKRGLSPKKLHEVHRLSSFIRGCKGYDKIVDVGSGAGHLERVLLKYGVTSSEIACVESSNSHIESASKWNRTADIETVVSTVANSKESFQELDSKLPSFKNGLMVGLHACGDLTNAMMNWFLTSPHFHHLAVVSCCFHKMKTFPVSNLYKNRAPIHLRSHFALRLACQDKFVAWNEQTPEEHNFHSQTFGRRAQLEAIALKVGCELAKNNRHGVRNIHLKTDQEFIQSAIKVYGLEAYEGDVMKIYEEIRCGSFGWLENLTGLQAFLQILLEYFVLLDKVTFLGENGLKAQLIQIFDEKLSPRCLLLDVIKR